MWLEKKFLNFSNRFLSYGNEAILPFYIMHETAIVVSGFYVFQPELAVGPKYAIMVVSAPAMTVTLYEAVKRTNVTRFLWE